MPLGKPGIGTENMFDAGSPQPCGQLVERGIARIGFAACKRSRAECHRVVGQANPYLPLHHVAAVVLFGPVIPAVAVVAENGRIFRAGGQHTRHGEQI
jgi:hypothetical protein